MIDCCWQEMIELREQVSKTPEDSLKTPQVLHLCKNRRQRACWPTHVQTHIQALCYSNAGVLMENPRLCSRTPHPPTPTRRLRVFDAASHREKK